MNRVSDHRKIPTSSDEPAPKEGALARIAISFTAWAERWFPDAFVFVAIGGDVVAVSSPAQRLIHRLAEIPSTGPGAVGLIAAIGMLASLLNWGLSLIWTGEAQWRGQ